MAALPPHDSESPTTRNRTLKSEAPDSCVLAIPPPLASTSSGNGSQFPSPVRHQPRLGTQLICAGNLNRDHSGQPHRTQRSPSQERVPGSSSSSTYKTATAYPTFSVNDSQSGALWKKRRAKRTEQERINYLNSDPYVSHFEPYRVLCAICDKWIRLRPNSTYCSIPWDAHRKSCLARRGSQRQSSSSLALHRPPSSITFPIQQYHHHQSSTPMPSRSSGGYTYAELQHILSQDRDVRKFDLERVLCRKCDHWIGITPHDHLAAVQIWLEHRAACVVSENSTVRGTLIASSSAVTLPLDSAIVKKDLEVDGDSTSLIIPNSRSLAPLPTKRWGAPSITLQGKNEVNSVLCSPVHTRIGDPVSPHLSAQRPHASKSFSPHNTAVAGCRAILNPPLAFHNTSCSTSPSSIKPKLNSSSSSTFSTPTTSEQNPNSNLNAPTDIWNTTTSISGVDSSDTEAASLSESIAINSPQTSNRNNYSWNSKLELTQIQHQHFQQQQVESEQPPPGVGTPHLNYKEIQLSGVLSPPPPPPSSVAGCSTWARTPPPYSAPSAPCIFHQAHSSSSSQVDQISLSSPSPSPSTTSLSSCGYIPERQRSSSVSSSLSSSSSSSSRYSYNIDIGLTPLSMTTAIATATTSPLLHSPRHLHRRGMGGPLPPIQSSPPATIKGSSPSPLLTSATAGGGGFMVAQQQQYTGVNVHAAPLLPMHDSRRRNAEQRAAALRADNLISQVEPNRVFCSLCQKWVQLRQDSTYCAYPWLQHRGKCLARHQRRAEKAAQIAQAKAQKEHLTHGRTITGNGHLTSSPYMVHSIPPPHHASVPYYSRGGVKRGIEDVDEEYTKKRAKIEDMGTLEEKTLLLERTKHDIEMLNRCRVEQERELSARLNDGEEGREESALDRIKRVLDSPPSLSLSATTLGFVSGSTGQQQSRTSSMRRFSSASMYTSSPSNSDHHTSRGGSYRHHPYRLSSPLLASRRLSSGSVPALRALRSDEEGEDVDEDDHMEVGGGGHLSRSRSNSGSELRHCVQKENDERERRSHSPPPAIGYAISCERESGSPILVDGSRQADAGISHSKSPSPSLTSSRSLPWLSPPASLRRSIPSGLADLDSDGGRQAFVWSSICHLFATTFEPTDDLSISALHNYLGAALPQDKFEDFDVAEVVRALAALRERDMIMLVEDIIKLS